ncbi:MAG TPA: hypothetical protein VGP72_16895 [Planctomycetota bacterium]
MSSVVRSFGLLILTACVLCDGADFTPSDEAQARKALQESLIKNTRGGGKVRVWIDLFGKPDWAEFTSCDEKQVSFLVSGNVLTVTWERLKPEQLTATASACFAKNAEGLVVLADFYAAAKQTAKADEVLTKAVELSPTVRDAAAARWAWLKQNSVGPAKESTEKTTTERDKSVAPTAGKADRSAVLRLLTDFSLAGADRRLGPDYAFYHKGQAEKIPEIWMPPSKDGGAKNRHYQVGGPWSKDAGDYSSTQGQILYVPDNGLGVDRVTVLEMSNNCFSEKPEPPWWGGFRPEPASKHWQQAAGGHPGAPVFMARGMGTWSNCGVIVFSSGLVATAGTCTGKGSDPALLLPRGKIPTAISVTNKNEFALITVCDVEQNKGQVAVIALESSAKKTGFAHEWKDDHPCLPNVAVFTRMKLLGFVDLPGISFPSGISAVGDTTMVRLNGPDGNQTTLRTFDLSQPGHRECFYNGNNGHYCSRCGFAVVISSSEGKVAFLDLQPLFARVREMYFTSDENYKKTRDSGPDPKQWPQTFDVEPSWKPPVVAVLAQPQPTAVLASMEGGKHARAFVASQDGRIGIYKVGGLATEAAAGAQDAACIGTVQVGRNPVCLAYQKFSHDSFLAVSRGDREIAWVHYSEKGAEVARRLRDARLLDPVHVEVADTHGIQTALITVADFKGRKIVNYRYSELVFATNGGARFGMGADGKADFECGGVLEFPGAPFCISATNVN